MLNINTFGEYKKHLFSLENAKTYEFLSSTMAISVIV